VEFDTFHFISYIQPRKVIQLIDSNSNPTSKRKNRYHINTLRRGLFGLTLAVRLGRVVALVDNKVLRLVVFTTREVRVEKGLGTSCVALLRIDRGTRHVGNHGVASAPWVLCVAERVVLGRGLREPDVTTVATELSGLERVGDVFLDDNGATGSVDEP
jgi:hypothetical protein